MPRRLRLEKVGFYHIINRGVAKGNIYLNDNDYLKFLEIIQDASDEFAFGIYSFCLMDNHYHLLLKTTKENLSEIMQKINSRYSIYFNNKYKRVGPLFQGRFKSWFVYDEQYLKALIKYIEFNPVKAKMVDAIGVYRWSMSSYTDSMTCLNYELIESIDFSNNVTTQELKDIDKIFSAKFEIKEDIFSVKKKRRDLKQHFSKDTKKEFSIASAIADGYTQTDIAFYLKLSNVSISKIYKKYRQKVQLFNKLRDKGLFWSYDKSITYSKDSESLFIEHLMKYGDFDDIKLGFDLFGKRIMFSVWDKKLKLDKQFIKLNLMLSRLFFNMNVESSYFKELKNERFEKFRLLAS